MCCSDLTDAYPSTTVTYKVTFTHEHSRWYAHVCSHSVTTEGEIEQHGSTHKEFGPFAESLDVARWLLTEVHLHTKLQGKKMPAKHGDPPQG